VRRLFVPQDLSVAWNLVSRHHHAERGGVLVVAPLFPRPNAAHRHDGGRDEGLALGRRHPVPDDVRGRRGLAGCRVIARRQVTGRQEVQLRGPDAELGQRDVESRDLEPSVLPADRLAGIVELQAQWVLVPPDSRDRRARDRPPGLDVHELATEGAAARSELFD